MQASNITTSTSISFNHWSEYPFDLKSIWCVNDNPWLFQILLFWIIKIQYFNTHRQNSSLNKKMNHWNLLGSINVHFTQLLFNWCAFVNCGAYRNHQNIKIEFRLNWLRIEGFSFILDGSSRNLSQKQQRPKTEVTRINEPKRKRMILIKFNWASIHFIGGLMLTIDIYNIQKNQQQFWM